MGKQLLGSIQLNRIYQMDCLHGMKLIPDNSIDLVVTDPPYLINFQSGFRQEKFEKIQGDSKSNTSLISESLQEMNRLLKEGSHIYMFCSWHRVDFFKTEFEKHFELKNILIWRKRGGSMGDLETQYAVDYEFILFGYKKWYVDDIKDEDANFRVIKDYLKKEKMNSQLSNKQISLLFSEFTQKHEGCLDRSVCEHYFSNKQWCLPTKEIYENVLQPTGFWKKPFEELEQEYNKLRKMYDKRKPLKGKRISGVVETGKVSNASYVHPTQKPLELIQLLIEKSSDAGNVVMDCFMGSGTTAVVCEMLDRKWVGFETEPKYVEIANMRLDSIGQAAAASEM